MIGQPYIKPMFHSDIDRHKFCAECESIIWPHQCRHPAPPRKGQPNLFSSSRRQYLRGSLNPIVARKRLPLGLWQPTRDRGFFMRNLRLTDDIECRSFHCPSVFHNHAAFSRHRHAISVTNKQAPYDLFKPLNSTNNRRRIDFQNFCRFSKTALFSSTQKNPQIVP